MAHEYYHRWLAAQRLVVTKGVSDPAKLLERKEAAIDRPVMLASVAAGLASNEFPDAATWLLREVGIKIADLPNDPMVPGGIAQMPLTFSLAVILAPLGEELLFRGLLLDWLKQKVAAWQAVLISSLIFALLHNNHLTMGPAGWIELVDRVLMGVGASILALRGVIRSAGRL